MQKIDISNEPAVLLTQDLGLDARIKRKENKVYLIINELDEYK